MVSAVGDDDLGREIIENFTAKGLKQLIADVPYPTGTVQVEIDQSGVPQYEIKENVAWDNIPYTERLESLAKKDNGSLLRLSCPTQCRVAQHDQPFPRRRVT